MKCPLRSRDIVNGSKLNAVAKTRPLVGGWFSSFVMWAYKQAAVALRANGINTSRFVEVAAEKLASANAALKPVSKSLNGSIVVGIDPSLNA